jgi:hypothetical protein
MWPSFTFGHLLWLGFDFFPRALAGPKAVAAGNEEVSLPGELAFSSQILTMLPMAAISLPTSRL